MAYLNKLKVVSCRDIFPGQCFLLRSRDIFASEVLLDVRTQRQLPVSRHQIVQPQKSFLAGALAPYHHCNSEFWVCVTVIAFSSGKGGYSNLHFPKLLKHGVESLFQDSVGVFIALTQLELVSGSLSLFNPQISSIGLLEPPRTCEVDRRGLVIRTKEIWLLPFRRQ